MNKYANGKIYKLCSFQTKNIYIGSTIQQLSQRMASHRQEYKLNKNQITSKEILQYNDATIVLIEDFPCNNKQQLEARERYWIEQSEHVVNKIIPTRTKQEYYNNNKQHLLEKQKEYRISNYEKIKERVKKYDTTEQRKQYFKEYRNKNKTEINNKAKMKRELTKEFLGLCKMVENINNII